MRPKITKQNIKTLLETKFIKVFDLQYAEGRHYYNATRRSADDLVAVKSTEEFQNMLPDAVSCITIWNPSNGEPKLLLNREFRYPAGQFLLSVPAGLIDPADKEEDEPLLVTAKRELKEETGMDATLVNPRFITGVDEALLEEVINPCLFSTPGMTDESNALVKIVLNRDTLTGMSQDGAEGSECFDGFSFLTKEQAQKILKDGVDEYGIFYSVYTWTALTYFVADMWNRNPIYKCIKK